MKKSLAAVIISLLLFVLVACTFEIIDNEKSSGHASSETKEEQQNDKVDKQDETENQKDDNESVMEIYKKAIDAAEQIESAEILVEADQIFAMDDGGMETSSNFTIQMTMDPFAMHQKGTTTMSFGPSDEETMDMEIYLTDDDMYFYEGFSGQWINMGGAMGELMDELAEVDEHQDPYEQLKMFEDHIEKFTIEVTNDTYILDLTVDADSFDEAYRGILEDTMSGDLEMLFEDEAFDPFEDTDIQAMSYKIMLDKKTLQIKEYDMHMDMSITEQGESINIVQDIHSVYTKINDIGPIEVPQEVIDAAVGAF